MENPLYYSTNTFSFSYGLEWTCFRGCIGIMSWYPVWHSYNLSPHISCCRPRVKNSRVTPSPFAQASAFLCSPTQWIACLLANRARTTSSVSIAGSLRAKASTSLKEILSDEGYEVRAHRCTHSYAHSTL